MKITELNNSTFIINVFFLIISFPLFAQGILAIYEGDMNNLSHVSKYDFEFSYDNLPIPYFDKTKKEDEKYQEIWFDSRDEKYHPAFLDGFYKIIKKKKVQLKEDDNVRFLIKIHIKKIDTGAFAVMVVYPAIVEYELEIIDKLNPKRPILKVIQSTRGNGNKTTAEKRISHAYFRFGKVLAESINDIYVYDPNFKDELTEDELAKYNQFNQNKLEVETEMSDRNTTEKIDTIYKKDGTEIKSNIIEITENTIKYKKVNQLDGPLRNIMKEDVFMIIYKDGTREVF